MDVDSIALGRDFRQILQERLQALRCDGHADRTRLARRQGTQGNRRLDSTTDFVRQEIAGALKRNIPVIPVLLQGAHMPPPERLPDDSRISPFRNGFELATHVGVRRPGDGQAPGSARSERRRRPRAPSTEHAGAAGEGCAGARRVAIQRGRLIAAAAFIAGIAWLLYLSYPKTQDQSEQPATQIAPLSQPPDLRGGTQLVAGGAVQTAALPRGHGGRQSRPALSNSTGSGGDCWDIFRGAELVTYQCGAKYRRWKPAATQSKRRTRRCSVL